MKIAVPSEKFPTIVKVLAGLNAVVGLFFVLGGIAENPVYLVVASSLFGASLLMYALADIVGSLRRIHYQIALQADSRATAPPAPTPFGLSDLPPVPRAPTGLEIPESWKNK